MFNKIRLASVWVSDQDVAYDFYVNTLGLTVQDDTPMGEGMRWIEVVPTGGATALVLAKPYPGQEAQIGGFTGVVFSADNVEATVAELEKRGVTIIQPAKREMWGGTSAIFADPDGNQHVIVDKQ